MLDQRWKVIKPDGTRIGFLTKTVGADILMMSDAVMAMLKPGDTLWLDDTHTNRMLEVKLMQPYKGAAKQGYYFTVIRTRTEPIQVSFERVWKLHLKSKWPFIYRKYEYV